MVGIIYTFLVKELQRTWGTEDVNLINYPKKKKKKKKGGRRRGGILLTVANLARISPKK